MLADQLKVATAKPDQVELVDALALALWWGEAKWCPRIQQPRPPANHLRAAIAEMLKPMTWDEMMAAQRRS